MTNSNMKRNLTSRHISMIAIGGSIGTGLFIASGAVVSKAGSYGTLLAYSLVALVIYFLMGAVGELTAFYPVSGSFVSYSARFIDPAFAFGVGWMYTIMWILVAGVDILTIAKILQFWEFFQQFSIYSICFVLLLVLYMINLFSVAIFGEIGFWLTIIKILTVVVFLLVGLAVILGLGTPALGLQTFIENGKENSNVMSLFGVLSTVAFSFGGAEAVAITAGESNNPRETMPKAVNQVFRRLLFLYVATMFIISATILATDSRLSGSSIATSPFTILFENIGLTSATIVMNVVILTSVLSAANSALYLTSRQMFALSTSNYAPKSLSKINKKGNPFVALNVGTLLVVLVIALEKYVPTGYYILLSMIGVITIIIWVVAVLAHIRLRRAMVVQKADAEKLLPYRAKFGITGSYIALFIFSALYILQVYSDIKSGSTIQIIADVSLVVIIIMCYVSYKIINKSKFVTLKDMDISSYNYKNEK